MNQKITGRMILMHYVGTLFGGIAIVILTVLFFTKGALWMGSVALPASIMLTQIAFAASLVVFLPLSFIPRTYGFAASGLIFASTAIAIGIWTWALMLTDYIWGTVGVFVGLIILGIGMVPVALVATSLEGMWGTVGRLLVAVALMWGVRSYGSYVYQKSMRRTRIQK